MKYLVDTSALTRILRKQAAPAWYECEDRGLLTVCEPVLAETLLIATSRNYAKTEQDILRRFLPVTVPDGIWDFAAAIRRHLVPRGVHRGLSVADLVVTATAIKLKLKLEVLHEDADYETVARFMPELQQQRLGAGPSDI
jgi:predicted nucleic acid-binding protein